MTRWSPDANQRLRQAALELYRKHGYENTTVAEIAASAGLTERTFFRHFADKREVLFAGSEQLEQIIVNAIAAAPPSATPIEAVGAGLEAAGAFFNADRREYARRRHAVISATAELRERELIKMAALGLAIDGSLRRRGVREPAASLAAEAGVGVFRVAFERWVADKEARSLAALVRESLGQLQKVVSTTHEGVTR